ncbi:MAG TPA: DUF1326 domain-containing protein [Tepidisphaeraceae bacterium]|jgi:hypothetical protein|nr:DUF1326 domain-containing protein [Tepidisphaeraceae bacterium]
MSRSFLFGVLVLVAVSLFGCSSNEKASTGMSAGAKTSTAKPMAMAMEPQWAMKADIIEACSCPMFCQCYFNAEPAAHGEHAAHGGGEHFCRFNNAYKISKGNWGATSLDGAKFWLFGDLGGDFSKGQMDWAVLTFDKDVSPMQREGIQKIMGYAFPVKWNSFTVGPEGRVEFKPGKDKAVARLNGGQTAEIQLKRAEGMSSEPIVIKNLRYWGLPRNDGFILMPNEVEALRAAPAGKQGYEFKGSNGFMITVDINSNDVAKTAKGG